ncbi:MAG: tetratricopeptide repeat protein [Acidobacteriota bacterium]
MGRRTIRRRSTWLWAGLALLLLISIRHVGPQVAGVLDSPFLRLEARLVRSSWVLAPPPFLRLYRYPLEPVPLDLRFPRHASNAPLTREGAAVGVEGSASVRAIREGVLGLHARHGEDFVESLVRPLIREELGRLVGEQGYSGLRALGILAFEARLEMVLRRRLEAEGVALESLRVERLELGAPEAAARMLGRPARRDARVLLVGLDGADWNLIEPLMEAGRLPNLRSIVRRGARARLRTLSPVLSPVLWTSIATGKRPEKHGILDFLATSRKTGERIPVTSNLRRARPLWHILGDHGLSSSVVAWWATWPAEPLRGTLVTDRVAYQLFGVRENLEDATGKTYPADLYARLRPLVRTAESVTVEEIERFIPALRRARLQERYPDRIAEFKKLLASSATYTEIALRLLRHERAEFHAVYLEGIDTASHLFIGFRPPRLQGVSEEEAGWFGGVVDRFYEYQDEVLGRLMEAAGPQTTVLVCSDHGFRSGRNRPAADARIGAGRAAEWHRKYGVLAMAGPEIRSQAVIQEASIVDLAPTVLALFGVPAAEDFDGRVLEEALSAAFLELHPPRTIATYEPAVLERSVQDPIASASDILVRQKLAALGYLSLEGSNVYNNRGSLFLSEGRTDEAIAAFEEALRTDPNFLAVRINLGRAYLQKKDLDKAMEIFLDVLGRAPRRPDVENLLGNILMERSDLDGAEARFRRAVELDANFTDAHNSLGILYEKLDRLEEAERAYRQVTRIDADYAEAYNNLGNVLRAQGRWQEAVREYQRAIDADPGFHGSYNNLGLAYQDRGLLEEAQAALERGLQKAPRHPILHSSLGSLYYSRGEYAEAIREFQRAIELDRSYAAAYNNLGAAYGQIGKLREQERAYREALRIEPGYADARHNLALALVSAKRFEEALGELRLALDADPDHLGSWIQLGLLHQKRGEIAEAIDALERAKGIAPEQPQLYNRLGELYERAGQRERAQRQWRRSLQIVPDQPAVRERLQEGAAPGG